MTSSVSEHIMNWTRDATGRTYTRTTGDSEAMVWPTFTGAWVALVIHYRVAMAHAQCTSLEDAQTWSEARLAEMERSRT